MDVMKMQVEVVAVTDRVLPESALPDAATTIALPRRRNRPFPSAGREPLLGEGFLEQAESRGEIAVPFRQRPQRMQVVGQEHHRIDVEWMTATTGDDGFVQDLTGQIIAQESRAAIGDKGEEERPAGNKGAPIVGHATIVSIS